jgi:hypothetical protein
VIDMTTSITATCVPYPSATKTGYLQLLRASGDFPQPYGAVVFTSLTTLVRHHELVRPTTIVANGMLSVAEPHPGEGPAHGRVVPLPRAVRHILVRKSGSLTACLGIPDAGVVGLTDELRRILSDGEEAIENLEQLWPVAVHAAVTAAVTARARAAVLAYSGIHPTWKPATAGHAIVTGPELQAVADLLDTLVVAAGFGIAESPTSARASA